MKLTSFQRTKKARIEIIPLIDIVFFLLATFVMVSLSMVKNTGVPVNLPVAKSSVSTDKNDVFTITVTQDGDIMLDKIKVSAKDLHGELAELKQQHPDLKLIINGDTKAEFGQAIEVLDKARLLGITKITIRTKG